MTQIPSQDLFARWVEAPISALRKLPNGDGGFAALVISLALYERLIDSMLHRDGIKATQENFRAKASKDLGVDESVFGPFWNVYRNGLMHAFQPKKQKEKKDGSVASWGWELSEGEGYEHYPIVKERAERTFVVKLDPWKFTEYVVNKWRKNPELINQLTEFAFGRITEKTGEPGAVTASVTPPALYATLSAQVTATGQHPSSL